MNAGKDWKKWHTLYDDDESSLAKRLRLVQDAIGDCFPVSIDERYQIIDICSGDGRDLLDVLAQYPAKDAVHSYLVEIDERLAEESRRTAIRKGLQNVTIATDDASRLGIYKDVIPADLILICGVFGNISDDDIVTVVRSLAQLCKKNTKVIWTRNLRKPDVVTTIRDLFSVNNFTEVSFQVTEDSSYAVGVCEFRGSHVELDSSTSMFTFVK